MISIPYTQLRADQQAKLQQLVMHGGDDFLLLDDDVNGAPLLLIVARGAARDLVRGWIQSGEGAASEEEKPGVPVDQAPPVKLVPVTEGVRPNIPPSAGGLRSS